MSEEFACNDRAASPDIQFSDSPRLQEVVHLNCMEVITAAGKASQKATKLGDDIPGYKIVDPTISANVRKLQEALDTWKACAQQVHEYHAALLTVEEDEKQGSKKAKRQNKYHLQLAAERYTLQGCPKALAAVISRILDSDDPIQRSHCSYDAEMSEALLERSSDAWDLPRCFSYDFDDDDSLTFFHQLLKKFYDSTKEEASALSAPCQSFIRSRGKRFGVSVLTPSGAFNTECKASALVSDLDVPATFFTQAACAFDISHGCQPYKGLPHFMTVTEGEGVFFVLDMASLIVRDTGAGKALLSQFFLANPFCVS